MTETASLSHAPASPAPTVAMTPHRFEVLDSLRGVCACMIVLLHFKTNGVIANSTVVNNGFLFVDFFFVLSGFVIAASYGSKLAGGFSIPKFMALRLGRVYPLHFVMLMVFLAFELGFALFASHAADRQPFTGTNSVESLIASLLLIQIFVGPDGTYWNGPSWSIAAEVWTYLIFALAVRWLKRALVPACLAVAVACCIFLYFRTDRYLDVFHDGALARCLYGFSLGVVAYHLHGRLAEWRLPLAAATLIELGAIAATLAIEIAGGSSPISLAVPPVFFLVVLIFARQAGAVSRILALRPFLFVGALSYSIYMVHGFLEYRFVNVLSAIQRLSHGRLTLVEQTRDHNHIGGSALFGDAMSILMLAIAIGAAFITYRLIEKPAQRWSRRRVLGSHPRRSTVAAEREAPTF